MAIRMITQISCDEIGCDQKIELEQEAATRGGMRKMVKEAQEVGWSWKLVRMKETDWYKTQRFVCPRHATEWKNTPNRYAKARRPGYRRRR